MDIKRIEQYWLKNAELKQSAAESLYQSRKYADCLFFYHLSVESLLKALVVRSTQKPALFTHDLVRLAEITDLKMEGDQRSALQEITEFNMEARYPDEKYAFYQLATEEFAKGKVALITNIILWLKKHLNN